MLSMLLICCEIGKNLIRSHPLELDFSLLQGRASCSK